MKFWNKFKEEFFMRNLLVSVIIMYVILLLISSSVAVKSRKVQVRYLIVFTLSCLLLLSALIIPNIILIGLGLIVISSVTWKIAPLISGNRNVKHHIIRFVFHLSLIGLYCSVFV